MKAKVRPCAPGSSDTSRLRLGVDCARGALDGRDDARVGAAAADVARHSAPNLLLGRAWFLLQEPAARHDHAGDAVAALHRAHFEEGFLQRVQPPVTFETFDGRDLSARDRDRGRAAGANGLPVEQHRASAATALAAAVLSSSEVKLLAQDAEQAPLVVGREELDLTGTKY